MTRIVTISGGLSTPSSTRILSDALTSKVRELLPDAQAEVVELRSVAHPIVDAMLIGFPSGELARVLETVTAADALVVVSPVFSASISGLVKSFFDIVEPDALRGKPVLLAATGGTERHSLVLEYAMRPLLNYLGAYPVRTGVFAATADFGGSGATALEHRIVVAVQELVAALTKTTPTKSEDDGFVDFAALLNRR